jgi:hypothetical protein
MTTVTVKDLLDTKIISTVLNRKQQFQECSQTKIKEYVLKRLYTQ